MSTAEFELSVEAKENLFLYQSLIADASKKSNDNLSGSWVQYESAITGLFFHKAKSDELGGKLLFSQLCRDLSRKREQVFNELSANSLQVPEESLLQPDIQVVDAQSILADEFMRWRIKDLSPDSPLFDMRMPQAEPKAETKAERSRSNPITQTNPAALKTVSARMPYPVIPPKPAGERGKLYPPAEEAPLTPESRSTDFMSASDKYRQDLAKEGRAPPPDMNERRNKSLGGKRVVPGNKKHEDEPPSKKTASGAVVQNEELQRFIDDPRFEGTGLEPMMIERIYNDVLDRRTSVSWSDIAGLAPAKKSLNEAIILPLRRPDMFQGLRTPPRGLLLFGPPGTGKTMIGKAIATESHATFLNISASSLTSKWVGEGEKMVKALFLVARILQPSVIFIDEIDSLLTQRSESDYEASRRIKTEFLVQWDGVGGSSEDRILLIGATNRPSELDNAAIRRFAKRFYIPLPDGASRKQLIQNLLKRQENSVSETEIDQLVDMSTGYSGSDLSNLCKEAALGPVRDVDIEQLETIRTDELRPMNFADFEEAFSIIRTSVAESELAQYEEWNRLYGMLYKK